MIDNCLCIRASYLTNNKDINDKDIPDIFIIPIEQRFLDFLRDLKHSSDKIESMRQDEDINSHLFSLNFLFSFPFLIFPMKEEDAKKLFESELFKEDEEISIIHLKQSFNDPFELKEYMMDYIPFQEIKKNYFVYFPVNNIEMKSISLPLLDDMILLITMESQDKEGLYFQSQEFSYNQFFNLYNKF